MVNVKDVFDFLNEIAPVRVKDEKDNVGLLVGRSDGSLSKILVSLDITTDVISEAIDKGTELIVSHHPLFFSLKSITNSDTTGKKALTLIENGIAAICMHTNLDAARGGVNDVLAKAAGIDTPEPFVQAEKTTEGGFSCGRFGYLKKPLTMREYLSFLQNALNANGLRYYDAGRDVSKVSVVGGSGGVELGNAHERGCDTFITADIKYHLFLEAKELGINIIDGGHFCTENVIIPTLADKLRSAFPDVAVIISKMNGQTIQFF